MFCIQQYNNLSFWYFDICGSFSIAKSSQIYTMGKMAKWKCGLLEVSMTSICKTLKIPMKSSEFSGESKRCVHNKKCLFHSSWGCMKTIWHKDQLIFQIWIRQKINHTCVHALLPWLLIDKNRGTVYGLIAIRMSF